MRRRTAILAVAMAAALLLGACATVHNLPLNTPSATPFAATMMQAAAAAERPGQPGAAAGDGGSVVALAFSGGGTRAAAFAYGVLTQLARTPAPGRKAHGDLLDHVGLVSGVSGGSVMAAYYGLKARAALGDFRQRFLTQDVMASLDTNVNLININRALGGGANTDNRLRNWFNVHLFHHATFGTLLARRRPIVLINATDIYDRTPFLFVPPMFAAACSDITRYPLAAGVAASAAVPAAFAPIVIKTYPGRCHDPLPPWVVKAANDPTASPLVHSFARGMEDIHSGKVKYVKLFDGGLIDNYGLSGITIIRTAARTPYAPLPPQAAVRMRRLLFLVVDAGQGRQGNYSRTLQGPAGKELISAVVDVLIDANAHANYAAFQATMRNWRRDLVRWRCGLKRADVIRLRGSAAHWNCRDLKFTITRLSFDQLGKARARVLDKVPTSFTLPVKQVDAVTQAGRDALQANPEFKAFLKGK